MLHSPPDRNIVREPLWRTEALPLTVGCTDAPHNPAGLPDTFPFTLALDRRLGLLVQTPEPGLETLLDRAYAAGSLLGTAMDDTPLGRGYAEDFLRFVAQFGEIRGRRALEIGAGRGYFLRLMADAGADAIGIEPGMQNAPHWQRFGVRVVADSFPSPKLADKFDLIVGYAVIEHVSDMESFLAAVRRQLRPDGCAIFSVPNSTEHIASGDPSMLLHEHFSYFTEMSLRRTLEANGMAVVGLARAGFGGALYVAAKHGEAAIDDAPAASELAHARAFGEKIGRLQASVRRRLDDIRVAGKRLGIYCPARALALLESADAIRFFDDDSELHGRFYPPFGCPVEARGALLDDPVDELWIMSRTFGPKLRKQLSGEPALRGCRIRLPDDLVPAGEPAREGLPK